MADDLNTEIKIGADASGVEAGVSRAKRSLADLGASAKKAGQDAGAGIGSIGAGGDKAAKDVERATKSMQNQLQRVVASFEAGEKGSRKFYESLARQRGADVATLKPLLDQLDAYKAKSDAAAQASAKAGSSFAGLGAAAGIAARAVAAIGITASVGEFIRLADASTNVASRLGLVTSSAAELASVQQRLFGIAQSSRVSFADLVGTYAQVARSTKDLGVSQNALLGVIQTISQAVTISGGSAASAQAALVQLSQGFAAGALRGEELNSIMEQTPRLAQAIADGLGVSVGKLRELGQAGELTAEKVLGALEKSAAGVAVEFGKMAVTVEQASTNAANSVLKLVGAFDKLTGVTSTLGRALQGVSGGLDFISRDVEKLGGQGPLRAAAREVLNLDAQAQRLRTGMASGVLGPNAENELARINAKLAEAKQRFRDLDKQLGGTPDPRDQTGFTGRGASYANEAKRLQKLQEDANKFRLNLAGVPDGYVKEMTELIRLNQAGIIVGKEYTDALKKQQEELLKKTGVTKGSNAAATQEQNAYESLIASIRAKIAEDRLELEGGLALTESQKLRIKLDQDLAAGRVKLGSEREKQIRLDLDALAVSEAEVAAKRAMNKANIEAGQTREKYLASLQSGIEKIRADITAQEDATARMGLSKQAVADLDSAKLEMLATDTELQAIKALDRNLDQQTYDSLKEQAKLYRDLAAAKRAGAAKETALDIEKANEEAAKKAAEDWQRASDDINRSLTDALLRGFESGKDFAQNLRDTLKNMFSTLVLRPIISAVINPVAGAITGALGLAGAANAGTSALGAIGSAASGASFLGNAAGLLGGAGTAAGYGFSALMSGNGLGALSGGLGMLTSGGPAAIMAQGAGMIAGVLGPIALGIGALTAIIGKTKGETRTGGQFGVAFDGSVTNQRRGQTYTIEGQQFDRDFTNGLQTALKDGIAYRLEGDPVAQESAIREAVAGTASGINGFLKALGSAATLTGFSAGLETSGKGRGGVFAGGLLSTGAAFGESGKGDNYAGTLYEAFSTNSPDFKTALENFTLDLKQATIQALQTVTDIPQAVQKLLKGVDAEGLTEDAANKLLETINAQIVGVNQFKDALKGMGLDTLAALSFDAAAGLAEVSGGFDKLLGNLQTYYTNFFTGEEQRANLQRSLAEQLSTLGLQLPDINASNARDQFRALVSAAEKDMSESGRKTYATLLALSGAFASITEAAQTTTQTLEQQRQAYYGALQDAVSARNKSLQSQLRTAQEVESTLDNIFGILRSNVRELYGEVDGTRGMLASQGNAFIEQALAAAKKSGYLPDADKLAEAISAVRGGIDGGAYTTQFASDRDRLVLAGKLAGLEKITEKQLTDAQKTVRALETQIDQNEQVLDYWKQQIDIASGTYDGILSVEAAVQQLSASLGGTGTTKPLGANTVGGGSTPASGTGAIPRTSYGAEEALTSFEKFKAWYTGLRSNADVNKLLGDGYQVPDWLRVSNYGADDDTDKSMFGSYLFFKNNPQYAADYQQILDTGRSSFATDGSTLLRTDISKLPADIAAFYKGNSAALAMTEGFGLDPVLAYQLYNTGPAQFGLDQTKQSFTEWLQNNKWTPDGIVSNNNVLDLAKLNYPNYKLPRWEVSSGNIIDLDGTIYTPDGKRVGRASQAQLDAVYGPGYKPTAGSSMGGSDDYLTAIKTNIDSAINSGWSAQQLADGLISTGTSLKDVADAYGISVEQVKENLLAGGATNIPKFDIGTNYVPRDMLAYIHEGEAVVPKAYNPAAGGGGAGSGRLELLVEQLIEKVAALESAASETAGNTRPLPQLGRQFDQYSNGGQFSRQKVVA